MQSVGNINFPINLTPAHIRTAIDPDNPGRVRLSFYEYGFPAYNYWAMQYMFANFPELINSHWESDIGEESDEITITFYEGEPPPVDATGRPIYPEGYDPVVLNEITFMPEGYTSEGRFIYAAYSLAIDSEDGPVISGELIELGTAPFPSTSGFVLAQSSPVTQDYTLTTTVTETISYSDEREGEESISTSEVIETKEEPNQVWEQITYKGNVQDSEDNLRYSERKTLHFYTTHIKTTTETTETTVETVEDDVEKTTTVTTITEHLEVRRTYHEDTQITQMTGYTGTQLFIYRMGSGNPLLDTITQTVQGVGEFFPHMPLRLKNKTLSSTNYPDLYENIKKGYKKSVGAKLDELLDSINESESIKDIDSAYLVFGTSLNTKDNSAKKYIYNFFKTVMAGMSKHEHDLWENNFILAQEKQQQWLQWSEAQNNSEDPLFGTPEPEFLEVPHAPASNFNFRSNHFGYDYNVIISWNAIYEIAGVGKYKPDAKKGQVWIEQESPITMYDYLALLLSKKTILDMSVSFRTPIVITWQDGNNSYRRLFLHGLTYKNIVYRGKAVEITAADALLDVEESGFIVPLHSGIYRSMSLVDATQMANSCVYVIFNSYEVVKQKWYQTSFFKIIVFAAVVVFSIYFPPAGSVAGGSGIMGGNAAIGASIGFTGTAAVVAGATLNAVAAMVITQVLTEISIGIFGPKWGAIIGAVLSIATINMGTSISSGGGWADNLDHLMRAENLIRLGIAVGKGVMADINHETMKKYEETQALVADYEKEAKKIRELWEMNLGTENGIDILALQEMLSQFDFRKENVEAFITRTLMTGDDIARLTHDMIDNFASMTTSPELP